MPLEPFVLAQVWIKKAAALTHKETGRLDPRLADAVVAAADEVLAGQHREHFVVDPYQAGAGTSHNMNANEVLANRANELLGGKRGEYKPVHPNDHVNMAQSTNDTIPTNIRLACLCQLKPLVDAFERAARTPSQKRAASSTTSSRPAGRTCRTPCQSGSARSSPPTPARSSAACAG